MLFYTLPRLTDLFLFALDDARRAFELLLGIGDVVVVLAAVSYTHLTLPTICSV